MKISKALFDDPKAARNVAATMHEAPRESKSWAAWVLVGMVLGAALTGIAWEYNKRTENYRVPAESQSGGQLSQPTAVPR